MSDLPVSVLKSIIFGDNMDLDKFGDVDELPNPFEQLKHDGAVRAALGKSNSRASLVLDMSVPTDNVDSDDGQFYKAPAVLRDNGPMTLKKRLGIVRSEEITTAAGDVWLHGFDANNQLVDARLLRCAAD